MSRKVNQEVRKVVSLYQNGGKKHDGTYGSPQAKMQDFCIFLAEVFTKVSQIGSDFQVISFIM